MGIRFLRQADLPADAFSRDFVGADQGGAEVCVILSMQARGRAFGATLIPDMRAYPAFPRSNHPDSRDYPG